MIIKEEKPLSEFEFSDGASLLGKMLTDNEKNIIENILMEEYPDGISERDLNDIFDHSGDTIAEWLGYQCEDDIICRDEPAYLFRKALEIIEEEASYTYSEFDFAEPDVINFLSEKEMSQEDFLDHGWKEFAMEKFDLLEEPTEEEYADDLDYLRNQKFINDLTSAIENKDFSSEMRDSIVEKLSDMNNYSEKLQSDLDKLDLPEKEMERDDV